MLTSLQDIERCQGRCSIEGEVGFLAKGSNAVAPISNLAIAATITYPRLQT